MSFEILTVQNMPMLVFGLKRCVDLSADGTFRSSRLDASVWRQQQTYAKSVPQVLRQEDNAAMFPIRISEV
jgi:hypothetical protein